MGIKNLNEGLNESGKIKIGRKGKVTTSKNGKEFRPGERFDHFELTTTEKDENDDFVVDLALMDRLKANPDSILNNNKDLVGIPIRLLYDDDELNFPNRYNSYIGTGNKPNCYGDGITCRKIRDKFTKDHPCPCPRLDYGNKAKDVCKPTGTLTCILDDAGLIGQAHKFRTTGINSIKGIMGGINLIKAATRGRIAGLPLILTLNHKNTSNGTVYVVSICYSGTMNDLRDKVISMYEDENKFLIGMDQMEAEARESGVCDILPANEVSDFIEEFVPDAVVNKVKQIEQVKVPEVDQIALGLPETLPIEDVIIDDVIIDDHGNCSICGEKQFDTSSGKTCINGHGGADTNTEQEETDPEPETAEPLPEKSKQDIDKHNAQLELVDRLNKEADPVKAFALSKRLVKEYLIQWIKDTYIKAGLFEAEKMPPESSNKPVFVAVVDSLIKNIGTPRGGAFSENKKIFIDPLANPESDERNALKELYKDCPEMTPALGFKTQVDLANYASALFKPDPVNRTLNIPGLLALVKRRFEKISDQAAEKNEKDINLDTVDAPAKKVDPVVKETARVATKVDEIKKTDDGYNWDDGPTAVRHQLMSMRSIKSEKNINTMAWKEIVSRYLKEDGEPVESAVAMTEKQAEHMLLSLDYDIPF